VIKLTVIISVGYHCYQLHTTFYRISSSQGASEINRDNLKIVRLEASRYFRNKKREYLKDKINELASNSKNKNISYLCRRINEFKSGYQSRNTSVKDENSDLLADSHNILNRWKNYVSHLLNVHNVMVLGR
jgi:hypothetical protein